MHVDIACGIHEASKKWGTLTIWQAVAHNSRESRYIAVRYQSRQLSACLSTGSHKVSDRGIDSNGHFRCLPVVY